MTILMTDGGVIVEMRKFFNRCYSSYNLPALFILGIYRIHTERYQAIKMNTNYIVGNVRKIYYKI